MKLIQKHAPLLFDDLVFADDATAKRLKQYAAGQRDEHLLLFGSTGTGKSTAAKLITAQRCRVQPTDQAIEPIDGSAFSHADFEKMARMWNWQSAMGSDHPTVIIDEIDQLKTADLLSLRSFIDKFTGGTIIATTNHLHKLDHPLVDRFDPIELRPPSVERWADSAMSVLATEGSTVEHADLIRLLSTNASGSIREVFAILTDIVQAQAH
jgi:replication-associated recombination protein RarA